jgi:glucosamine-6-phosphate deaminase
MPSPTIQIFNDKRALGAASAEYSAKIIQRAIEERGVARVLVATGNSQLETVAALVARTDVNWSKVEAFHLDEYVGIGADHPASFRFWVRTRFVEKVRPKSILYLQGDAPDPDVVARSYGDALLAAPIDLAFVGFGENGHIAFNDPPVADFEDLLTVKRVALDEACRNQQVGEGHFAHIGDVPREALTVTCSGLFRARHWVCCAPDTRKANAVKAALEGPITTACPASLVRRHESAAIFLDSRSAALLSNSK